MKKTTLNFLLCLTLLSTAFAKAQCLAAVNGLYPAATSTAAVCDGITVTSITTLGSITSGTLHNNQC